MQAQEELFQSKFEKQYEKLEKLGEGCSSEVIKCQHKKMTQLRAAKIIKSHDDEYIQIHKQEYEIMKQLDHPNVVKVFDLLHDELRGQLIMIMEYV